MQTQLTLVPFRLFRASGGWFACLCLVLSISGCGDAKLAELDEGATILAFGDSLTLGIGTTLASSYPAQLQSLSGRTVINKGISGEITAEGLARLPGLLDELLPDLLILMHGGNDILRNLNQTTTKANLQAMIDAASERSVPTVLIGIPEKKLFSSVAPLYRELAEANELVLEDDIIASLLRKPAMKSDSVHFNARGYQAIAERLYELLDESGAW